LWAVDTDGTETQVSGTTYGTFIANKGVIIIPSGVINSQTNLKAEFKNKSVIIGLNNLVTLTVNNVTVV
jgi:hypothetical protein